jgi:hypothetical protein
VGQFRKAGFPVAKDMEAFLSVRLEKGKKKKGNYRKERRTASCESNWFPVDTGNEDEVPDGVCDVFTKRLVFAALKLASLTEHALLTHTTALTDALGEPLRGYSNPSFYVTASLLVEELHFALHFGNTDKF